jgi:hypothetical protein
MGPERKRQELRRSSGPTPFRRQARPADRDCLEPAAAGAILIYLADKTGKLLPKSGEGHYRVLEFFRSTRKRGMVVISSYREDGGPPPSHRGAGVLAPNAERRRPSLSSIARSKGRDTREGAMDTTLNPFYRIAK